MLILVFCVLFFLRLESHKISEESRCCLSNCSESVTSGFHVHLFPRSLFEDGGNLSYLGNEAEGVSAHVIQDGVSFTVLFLSTVVVDCESSVSEVAVLVVLEK